MGLCPLSYVDLKSPTFPFQTAGYELGSQEAMIYFLPYILFWNISDILMFRIAIFSQRDEIHGSWENIQKKIGRIMFFLPH